MTFIPYTVSNPNTNYWLQFVLLKAHEMNFLHFVVFLCLKYKSLNVVQSITSVKASKGRGFYFEAPQYIHLVEGFPARF